MYKNLKQHRFFKVFRNLYRFLKYCIYNDKYIREFEIAKSEIARIKDQTLVLNIFNYCHEFPELRENYKTELSYLINNPANIIFPYKQLKKLESVQSGYDNKRKLPYVIHNGKKLYFPKTWTVNSAVSTYTNFIENENILGGSYKEKSPHQYESDTFRVNESDVLMDIGCAEGLFALHVIDRVKKIYLIESDVFWIEALTATFEPYKNKVEIINKLISDIDTEKTITLTSILKKELTSSLFIKMDIEGYEVAVLKDSKDILNKISDIRIACCSYHKQTDAEELTKIFTSMDYEMEFSDGYMLFIFDELKPPYFRKGVIRAKHCRKMENNF